MASPNHKAGLAVVIPSSDISTSPQRKIKQHFSNSPRKIVSQSNGYYPTQQLPKPVAPQHSNGHPSSASSRLSKGVALPNSMNEAPSQHVLSGVVIHKQNESKLAHPQLLGVDEALKYSPLSSIVPFSSDLVPIPNAKLSNSTLSPLASPEQHTPRNPLDYLNAELSRNKGHSGSAQRVRNELGPFLDQSTITDFKFKAPTRPSANQACSHRKVDSHFQVRNPKIGAFAELVLQSTDIAHRYPTPTSPDQNSPNIRAKSEVPAPAISSHHRLPARTSQVQHVLPNPVRDAQTLQQQPPVTPTSHRLHQNSVAHMHNGALSTEDTHSAPSTHLYQTPMVIIPPTSAEARKSDFITYEEPLPSDKGDPGRKRKRDSEGAVSANLLQIKDQKRASDEIVRQFQEIVQDIFDADDRSQPGTSDFQTPSHIEYFITVNRGEREQNTLTPAIHVKLESSLQKIISAGRIEDIPVEHLQRLQGLCEGALNSAELSDLQIDPEWSAHDFESWVQKLDVADIGLRAARTILKIMTGGRDEKQIYSEELLQSLLQVVKRVLDCCIIPVVESRGSNSTTAIFNAAAAQKKVLLQLLSDTKKVMALLVKLLADVEMSEDVITGIEFFATPLLFVENSQSEKDSALGIQKFEGLRRTAMDTIAIIFSRYPDQHVFLFNEILASLQKLPITRQHARQFKLPGGKNIQLVSVLMLRLVQTSASNSNTASKRVPRLQLQDDQNNDSQSSENETNQPASSPGHSSDGEENDDSEKSSYPVLLRKLDKEAGTLLDNAAKSAQYVVRYLVQRAMKASKTGDQPHRQLLDLFVEDFITVLGLPEWPAAELLLRILLAQCRNIAEDVKSLTLAKNMALELLGTMGSAISDLVSTAHHAAKALESNEKEFDKYLRRILDDYSEGSLEGDDIVSWNGPYHAIVEYLHSCSFDDPQIRSAQDYYLARWARAVASGDLKASPQNQHLVLKSRKMLSGVEWPVVDSFQTLKESQKCVAYIITLLSMEFCRHFDYILKILLNSVTSEQTTVRTRSLKSVTQMLEKDPSILDRARSVKLLITNCAVDASPMVRDSALTLIGKCIVLRPSLEQELLKYILRLCDDAAVGVRKRSMKLLKDIYLRNSHLDTKTVIGASLLHRIEDPDSSVSELARQTFEDIWLSPYWSFPTLAEASAQSKIDLRRQTSLIISTARRGDKVASVLVQLLKDILSTNSKNAAGNLIVCQLLVSTAFELLIDSTQNSERLEQQHVLQTLTVFARASPRLFLADQIQNLQPYISNLSGKDDLDIFRSIVIIFRCVLPILSNVQHGLLQEIDKSLRQSLPKLGKAELSEVAECLWTINGTLQNPIYLIKFTASVVQSLRTLWKVGVSDSDKIGNVRRKRLIQIAGCFGKHCDFENLYQDFQKQLSWWKGSSVAGLLIESIKPFTDSSQPLSVRAEAFDSIGFICQSWPFQYTREHISDAFQDVLRRGEPELQVIVLSSFRDFFARMARQTEARGDQTVAGANDPANTKLGGSMTATEGDGASALIAQRFLKDILSIALATQSTSALTATEVLASINRQGLVHPKESGPALVALGTSTNPAIADVALQEHRLLHQQHESMFEREYMRAIQETFRYQKHIVQDTLGYNTGIYTSKLHGMFEIIKTSKSKYQKKFLSNLCSKVDFDLSKMDLAGSPPNALQFSRFLIENLAFFDYGKVDELLHTLTCMEKIVADTGSGVAHAINTEIFHITVATISYVTAEVSAQTQAPELPPETSVTVTDTLSDFSRLRQLTTASIILSSLWETRSYLRRLYGLSKYQQRRDSKVKGAAKDIAKAPVRGQGITGDKITVAIAEKVKSLDSEGSMIQQCKEFGELMSVDDEVKVAAEGEDELERPETPASGEEDHTVPMSGGSKVLKRKGSVSVGGTPMKKKKERPSMKRKKSGKSFGSDEEWD